MQLYFVTMCESVCNKCFYLSANVIYIYFFSKAICLSIITRPCDTPYLHNKYICCVVADQIRDLISVFDVCLFWLSQFLITPESAD